jgi:hypothetical protein
VVFVGEESPQLLGQLGVPRQYLARVGRLAGVHCLEVR